MTTVSNLATDVKKQHTVPRFLLNNFGIKKKGKRKQLFTFDKKNEKSYPQSVNDASTRNTFYNLREHPEKASLEPILGIYETKAAPIIEKIVSGRNISQLTEDEKIILATFTAVQRARSFGELEKINHSVRAIASKLERIGATKSQVEEQLGHEDSAERKNLFLKMILDQTDVITHLMNKDWILYETDKGNPYYISDNPVTLYNDIDMGPYANLGFALKGIQVHLPICTTLTLAFTCPSIAEKVLKAKQQAEQLIAMQYILSTKFEIPTGVIDYGKAYENGTPKKQTPDNVRFLNSLQVKFSEQYIYCEKNKFSLAKEMISDDSRYKSGIRMQVN